QMQHRPVADPGYGADVRCVEQSLQLVTREITDKGLISLLHRDRVDPTRLVEARRNPVLEEAEERVDRPEPRIARPGRVPALLLQMLEEGQDQRCVKSLDLDLRRLGLEPAGGEAEQELEALCICLTRVLAGPALLWQMFAQEASNVRSERSHAAPPLSSASPASAIWPIRTGVACKYQKLSRTCTWPRKVLSATICWVTAMRSSPHSSRERTAKVWRRSWIRGSRPALAPRSPVRSRSFRKTLQLRLSDHGLAHEMGVPSSRSVAECRQEPHDQAATLI